MEARKRDVGRERKAAQVGYGRARDQAKHSRLAKQARQVALAPVSRKALGREEQAFRCLRVGVFELGPNHPGSYKDCVAIAVEWPELPELEIGFECLVDVKKQLLLLRGSRELDELTALALNQHLAFIFAGAKEGEMAVWQESLGSGKTGVS